MSRLMVDPNDLAIAVVDVQPYFLDGWMAGESEPLLARLEFLFALATVYEVPLLATFEQPIETKGWLLERLEPFFPAHGQRHTKQTFNCCGEPSITDAIGGLGRGQIAVAGGETDVCVLRRSVAAPCAELVFPQHRPAMSLPEPERFPPWTQGW